MKIISETDKKILVAQAVSELENLFNEHQDKHVLFLTSGGSSFDLLKDLQVPSKNISIGVLDERYSKEASVNNFTQLRETEFFKRSKDMFEQIIDTTAHDGETIEEFASRFESLLKGWRAQFPGGVIIATVGMGPDGHISGIMPHPENDVVFEGLFNDPRNWVVGYDAGDKNPYRERATTTLPFLRDHIDYAVVYIVGENKRDALAGVLAEERKLNVTPARILHKMKNVSLFTDIIFEQ